MNKKTQRDQKIIKLLTKFRICSRNQIAAILFSENSNPINVCNRVLKRLVSEGKILCVKRERDKTYCYTANPSPIHHKSNKIDHYLKIVDFYIQAGKPEKCIIEPILGSYEPDLFFKDQNNNSICVEIQCSLISQKKMQTKINQFVSEYGKEHDSKIFVLCSDSPYKKLKIPKEFKIVNKTIPKEILFQN